MLQQTQVGTALPYYERWMARFPTVEILARQDEQAVLSVWQGMGYYRRCRMLLEGARWILENGLPDTSDEWRAVPGVGRYTAAAIASICFEERIAVVDGNVERVFARFAGVELSGSPLHREAWTWAQRQMPQSDPGDWNQAMMELGATVCRPRDPRCGECPLAGGCEAARLGRQAELPVRGKARPSREVAHTALVTICGGLFGLEPIPSGEWWEGMWRFPSGDAGGGRPVGSVRHVVTRHRVSMRVRVDRRSDQDPALHWFSLEELDHLPMPAPHRRALHLARAALEG